MFLIRTTFCLSLVVLLLPTDAQQQQRLFTTASSAVNRAVTFCDRNAGICAEGARHWATFKQKLEFGSRMAIDIASEQVRGNGARPPAPMAAAPQPAWTVPAGTLKPDDLAPAWRAGRV